jgi:hypothetical protein
MTDFPCTWWRYTGRYTAFIDDISSPILVRLDTDEERSERELPIGALWATEVDPKGIDLSKGWYARRLGDDGHSIACKMPGGHTWYIDGGCSNCTRKGEPHHCWVRHGSIGDALTIDKNGNTCSAGAGSIIVPGWHGFLRDGRLVEC